MQSVGLTAVLRRHCQFNTDSLLKIPQSSLITNTYLNSCSVLISMRDIILNLQRSELDAFTRQGLMRSQVMSTILFGCLYQLLEQEEGADDAALLYWPRSQLHDRCGSGWQRVNLLLNSSLFFLGSRENRWLLFVRDFEALGDEHLVELGHPMLERAVNIVMHLNKKFGRCIYNLLSSALRCKAPQDFVSLQFIWWNEDFDCEVLWINLFIFFVLLLFISVYG